MMKIAISAASGGALGMMDDLFERAPYFLVFDTHGKNWTTHKNVHNGIVDQNAGHEAIQTLKGLAVNTLITGRIGSEALQKLRANSVKVYCVEPGRVNDILCAFLEGHYTEFFASNERKGNDQHATGTTMSTEPGGPKRTTGDQGVSEGSQTSVHGDERQGRRWQEHHGCQRRCRTC